MRKKEGRDKEYFKRIGQWPMVVEATVDSVNTKTKISMKPVSSTIFPVKLKPGLRDVIQILISLVCLSLFVYTAREKLLDHERFLAGLSRVSFIGNWALPLSWLVPAVELLTALLLLLPKTNQIGLWSFIGVMGLFSVYILVALIWLEKLPCHCGGIIESLSWREHLLFNLGLMALAGLALRLKRKP
ncbi:MauE/DoxX family redox-associated membrane protein [Pedobacter agri]|uniref:MauE/DoxX family redox-associated membrane protein n=1 Tax=Pedobacter agri TaxID=454586 RepID=UPI00292CB6B2|nr:MauE/DoxX family redox-associated membrane protein [Pedobacter agri]